MLTANEYLVHGETHVLLVVRRLLRPGAGRPWVLLPPSSSARSKAESVRPCLMDERVRPLTVASTVGKLRFTAPRPKTRQCDASTGTRERGVPIRRRSRRSGRPSATTLIVRDRRFGTYSTSWPHGCARVSCCARTGASRKKVPQGGTRKRYGTAWRSYDRGSGYSASMRFRIRSTSARTRS
jgi:hypothetical protein